MNVWQASEEADQSTLGSVLWYLVSLLMELSTDEKHSLPLYAYVAGFGKASHK